MQATTKEITKSLLDELWARYLERVSYAKTYAGMVLEKGGSVVNDHIALRTFNTVTGDQPVGIEAISHMLKYLDYEPKGTYVFKQKKLFAIHYEHPEPEFPKIFVSQLEVDQLSEDAQQLINEQVKDTPYLLPKPAVESLERLGKEGSLPREKADSLVKSLADYFVRPWKIPSKQAVLKLNEESQYAAWTLLHGNSVNHFTAFINYQHVKEWPDLETTCAGLAVAGVPMKESIEGTKGSILQQSSTQAVKEQVEVVDEAGQPEKMTWTYAYYELAERGYVEEDGKRKMFSGFLGEQATHLFDMTKSGDS